MKKPSSKSDSLSIEEAKQVIREFVSPVSGTETLELKEALSRVLAEDVISPVDVPTKDNSAMDGYAFKAEGLDLSIQQTFTIVGKAHAGHAYKKTVMKGECVEIMTGGILPDGCDTMIQLENVFVEGKSMTIPAAGITRGQNIRLQGEDVKAGSVALPRGTMLRPAHLGLLASLGIGRVTVNRRVRVAFFSTGDELKSIGEVLQDSDIYDSNRYTLYGMLTRLGCELIDMGVVRDDPALLEAAFRKACEEADVVITTGGVSVGAADYTKEVMEKLGEIAFWNIRMRPGRPMALGCLSSNDRKACLFGLPGNSVAVMTTFYFFVRDAILIMMGAIPSPLPHLRVRSETDMSTRKGRAEYQRGILKMNDAGEWVVRTTGPQSSAILRSMVEANCMVFLPEDVGSVSAGDMVDVVLFEGLV